MLAISVADDGRGIDADLMRQKIIDRNLASAETAARLTEAEIIEFLYIAEGLSLLRSCGWHTIAQDEQSSAVSGMPKAAAQLNAAVEILPHEAIADVLVRRIALRIQKSI